MIKFNRFPDGKTKVITLSYDDGCKQDIKLVEIFNKYGIKGTFHLNSGKIEGLENKVQFSDIKNLYKGHEVALHTKTHPFLNMVPLSEVVQEIVEDKIAFEECTGEIIRGMSYPNGSYNDEIAVLIKQLGVDYSRTVVSTNKFNFPDDFLKWHPTCHHNDESVLKLKDFLSRGYRGEMFYLWGHSYEFDRNKPWDISWDIIEEFCKRATDNTEEIWLATNIEIYDYYTAVKSLKISANHTMVYNPSAIDVWIEYEDLPVKISSGETKLLK